MLSTVKIVSGAEGTPWTDDQRSCVMEIRSEHTLNDLTNFSILMHDMPDRTEETQNRILAEGNLVAVLVRPSEDSDWQVLFQGKVIELETHETQGGVGSTVLYKGVDLRAKMAGRSFTGAWSGTVSDVIEGLIKLDFSNCEVDAPENNDLDAEENPLAQNSNNLEFVRDQAVAFGFNFWVTYSVVAEDALGAVLDAIDPRPATVTIEPQIHWGQSSYLMAKLGETTLGDFSLNLPATGQLGAEGPIDFKIHVSGDACANVTSFEVVSDGQEVAVFPPTPNNTLPGGAAIPQAGANPFAEASDDDAPIAYLVPPAVQPGAGSEDSETVSMALETARGFNRRVKLSTTLRRLERISLPHKLGVLEGVADELSNILFRVSETVHVIRINDHYMDVTLESDGSVPAGGQEETLLEGAL